MKQIATMAAAVLLCTVLFFILEPFASVQTDKEEFPLPAAAVKSGFGAAVQEIDKIAEFPILPEQRKKLESLQQKRLESTQGMEPAKIEIPSLGLAANIEPTGVLENGEMGVPENIEQVGWFEPGFKVGTKGNAVLAGHVDSLTGPAIFYHLEKIEAGELVKITDANGREMVFEVKEKSSYVTDQAPIGEIFGASEKRMINLITCTGDFDRNIGSHEQRLVVSAELISDSDLPEEVPEAPQNVVATSTTLSWHAARNDAIIGYRVYEEDPRSGEMKKVETVSLFDRKKLAIQPDDSKRYFVVSVDVDLNESEKAEAQRPD
ncbi:sortase [Planomicrobium sp. YIM 101495]|uniref:class F sortase n=1 Tax=Planomicrobium sp. YIM 101495 TaxID=2665160 RepID=UPI0012B6EDC7|nr:sortase [Planomicrobium sp. YIM 101495]MTD31371.1 sortase [Planomicrobium sp. YIM 101495]